MLTDAAVAFSLANLCFLSTWFGPLYNTTQGYFNKLRLNTETLLALGFNLAAFAALTWCLLQLRRRSRNRWIQLGVHLFLFCALIPPLEFLRIHALKWADYRLVNLLRQPLCASALLIFLGLILWQHRRVAKGLLVLVGILSPLALFTALKIITLLLQQDRLQQQWVTPTLPPPVAPRDGQPRIVWVTFDEMDYRLAFAEPILGVRLPEFERLRAGAFFATNAVPPADCTRMSIPALTTGKRVTAANPIDASRMSLTLTDGSKAVWNDLPSIFSEARGLGFNTAAIGWFHPYDRIFPKDLNYCFWQPIQLFEYVRARTFGESLKRQVCSLAEAAYARYVFADICRSAIADALSVVTNRQYSLMFLHLPPPHTPGIYNPDKAAFTIIPVPKPMAYRNNLLLADRTLGQLRRALEACGEWEHTWLIVSSDHFWRESKVYDGRRDVRVPFVLKSAGPNFPVTYSPHLNTAVSYELVLAVLHGKIQNESEALDWLKTKDTSVPTRVYQEPGSPE